MASDTADDQIEETLADHELALKQVLDSLGSLETMFSETVAEAPEDELDRLEGLGRALEEHVDHLERLVRTLDDHKRALGEDSNGGADALAAAVERSRRRARQEPTPPGAVETDEQDP